MPTTMKELIPLESYNKYGHFVLMLFIVSSVTLIGMTTSLDKKYRSLTCRPSHPYKRLSLAYRNFIRQSCSSQYTKEYNSPVPLWGFISLNFALIMIVCLCYAIFVTDRVDEYKKLYTVTFNKDIELQPLQITPHVQVINDVDNAKRISVFYVYLIHLIIKFVILVLFAVLVHSLCDYPTEFTCLSSPLSNMFEIHTNAECISSVGQQKNNCSIAFSVINFLLVLVTLIETIHILILACKDREFTTDFEFCNVYLLGVRKPFVELMKYYKDLHANNAYQDNTIGKQNDTVLKVDLGNIKAFEKELVEAFYAKLEKYAATVKRPVVGRKAEKRAVVASGTSMAIGLVSGGLGVAGAAGAATAAAASATFGIAGPVVLVAALVGTVGVKYREKKKAGKVLDEVDKEWEKLGLLVEQTANELCRILEYQLSMLKNPSEAMKLARVAASLMVLDTNDNEEKIDANILVNRVLDEDGKKCEKVELMIKGDASVKGTWYAKAVFRKTGLRKSKVSHCDERNMKIYELVYFEKESSKAYKYGFRGEIIRNGDIDKQFNRLLEPDWVQPQNEKVIPEHFFNYKPYYCLIPQYKDLENFASNITSHPSFSAFVRGLYGYEENQPVKPVFRPVEPLKGTAIDLSNANMENSDLSCSEFERFIFKGCSFKECRVLGANFKEAVLENSVFDGAYLLNCCLENANVRSCSWLQANVIDCGVTGADIGDRQNETGSKWDGTCLVKANNH